MRWLRDCRFTLAGGADTLRWCEPPASLTELNEGWCIRLLRLLVDTRFFSDPDELASWSRNRAFSRSVICLSTGATTRGGLTDTDDSDAFLRSFLPLSSLLLKASPT